MFQSCDLIHAAMLYYKSKPVINTVTRHTRRQGHVTRIGIVTERQLAWCELIKPIDRLKRRVIGVERVRKRDLQTNFSETKPKSENKNIHGRENHQVSNQKVCVS